MTKNTLMKFIDSCVGNIARKIEDEFNESDHPRDKGGKFTSKGNEGRGGGADDVGEELIQVKRAAKAARRFKSSGIDLASAMEDLDIPTEGVPEKYLESVFEGSLSEDPKLLRKAEDYIERYESGELEKEADRLGSEDDDEGYMGLSKEELAEEEEYENARERARREKDDDRVTGPEDRDYMNEEDDTTNSAAKDVKSMRQHLDEELFELATTSESEEEFKSKVKRKFDQYRWLLKNGQQDELPVGGKRAEYALKKIQSEIDSGTSEYW